MSTYRFSKKMTWYGNISYIIEKKHFLFGWCELNAWTVSELFGYIKITEDEDAKKLALETVDRLIKNGDTVI